jgi:hypothetical protein
VLGLYLAFAFLPPDGIVKSGGNAFLENIVAKCDCGHKLIRGD